jgi:hypothetical protein
MNGAALLATKNDDVIVTQAANPRLKNGLKNTEED